MALQQLLGDTIIDNKGNETQVSSLGQLDGIMLYFSAHWCPPCRGFTPKLSEHYEKMKAAGVKMELIFVSSDRDQAAFDEYHASMPFKALPFADRARKEKLSAKFKVQGIPSLVVIDSDGNLITDDGREAITNDPNGSKFPWRPPTFAEAIGDAFVDNTGAQVGPEALAGKTVGIYFSAHWCGPCRGFTPILVETYKTLKAAGKDFEIIFASSDKDQAAFDEYFAEMPWLALPFADRERKGVLSSKFKVQGIPNLVIVDFDSGRVINPDGRSAVGADKEGAEFPWKPKPVNDLEVKGPVLNEMAGVIAWVGEAEQKQAVAALTPIAEETYNNAEEKGEDPDLAFLFSAGGEGLAGRVKQMMKLNGDDHPKLVIMSIPERGYYYSEITDSKDITAESVRAFVEFYRAGALQLIKL